ncbi:MAG: PQQ-dependent sugar dehydrogenase [Candidatus Rariloculaceae bacterium]
MRQHFAGGFVAAVAFCTANTAYAQLANPISEPITKQGLRVEVSYLTRLPDSRGIHPAAEDVAPNAWARVSYVRDLPDGRRFSNDSRGLLYLIDGDNEPSLYANLAEIFPGGAYGGLQSGFIGFEFHPEFAENGFLYTVHGEKAENNSAALDFIPPGYTLDNVTYHNVITEWHATDPGASEFAGSRREVLRVGHVVERFFHPFGHLGFNPTSTPGDDDYGLLYTSGSDLGFSNGGGPNAINPSQLQRLDSVVGAILRIDPRSPSETGGVKGLGDYTIPANNPFAADDDPATLGEIYAHGLRNAHRLSWDYTDGTLYAADIGMSQIEEINIIHAGRNYGWMQREGIYDNAVNVENGDLAQVYALDDEILDGSIRDEFTYPVAMYDHDEGIAITAGFAYRGSVSALQGKFVFGDIQRGRLFAADVADLKAADDGIPQTLAAVEEIQLFVRESSGETRDVTFWDLVEESLGREIARADLHLSEGRDGELFVTSRQDGTIRVLTGGGN